MKTKLLKELKIFFQNWQKNLLLEKYFQKYQKSTTYGNYIKIELYKKRMKRKSFIFIIY